MKSSFQRSLAYCAILFAFAIAPPPLLATSKETITMSVGRLLEEGHYTRQKLNDEVSKKFLQTYLELLDFSHLFFTQQDVDALGAKYGTSMGNDVLLGNLKPAYEIYDLYTKRVDERVAKVKELLKQPVDFKGDAKIESLVPGGPAQADGRLKVGDRITAVAQGPAEFVDVREMRLDKVVELIRGKKGTHVRLLVIPSDATDPSRRKNVELVRDEIKLKDQEARADIIIRKDENGDPIKLGWLTLPSFYADMDKHQKSTTRDVLALLKRLKKENIGGLVVDLRKNGGGSLEEEFSLTGLILKSA